MTSLLNPNDIEIKNKLINNINKCIENAEIYSFNKKNLISIVNDYNNHHLKLNIDKDKLLEYIILLIQNNVFDKIFNHYNQVNLLNVESINTFNNYLLSITNINNENNEPLLNLIQSTYNRWKSNIQDIDLIYYNIYNLNKSNEECLNLIKVSINELDANYNHMSSINNSIKELKETNEIHINLINELKEIINLIIFFLIIFSLIII